VRDVEEHRARREHWRRFGGDAEAKQEQGSRRRPESAHACASGKTCAGAQTCETGGLTSPAKSFLGGFPKRLLKKPEPSRAFGIATLRMGHRSGHQRFEDLQID